MDLVAQLDRIFNPRANLNATFQPGLDLCKIGNVAVVSQSGGMCVYRVNALTSYNVGKSIIGGTQIHVLRRCPPIFIGGY